MEKFTHKKMDPNEIPIIFVRDCKGNVQGKVSINEWNERRRPATLNELEIKLYRQSLVYYADQEYEKATDLLKFLIARTEYTRFEYIERLANIYHIMNEPVKEYQLLDTVLSVAELESAMIILLNKWDVAKLVRHLTLNQAIVGSNPAIPI